MLLLAALLVNACAKKETPTQTDLGLDYYPVETGKFRVYLVDSTVYQEIPRDTLFYHYQIKEVFGSDYTDAEGKRATKIERYIKKYNAAKPYDSLNWSILDVWSCNTGMSNVQVVEENQRITKLAFPVKLGNSWNGNAANNLGERNFSYTSVDQGFNTGYLQFDKSLEVLQQDYRTQISYEKQSEHYARGTGLISKNYTALYSNKIVAGQPVENRIEKGVICTYSLIATGHE